MKLLFLRALVVSALVLPSSAAMMSQARTQGPAGPEPSSPQTSPSKGKVVFSRSIDDSGHTTTTVGPAAKAVAATSEPVATDAERVAVTFTALDLEVHLETAAHQIAVRAHLTIRNDGKVPLTRIPLQISSSLNWEEVRVSGHRVSFPVATLNSDTDHTGQLHEAAVPLESPLAPGASASLDVVYSGTIVPNAQRLLTLGTPEPIALRSDWDEISPQFTGLRGFGNVVWYPVSTMPVILGDGSRLFDEVGRHKLSLTHAQFRLRLTVEFPPGSTPTIALANGLPIALKVEDTQTINSEVPGIATATFEAPALGFIAPSLFVAVRQAHAASDVTAYTTADDDISVQTWLTEDTAVTPFMQEWLGRQPRSHLTLLDLPNPDDAPFETGALLATSLHTGPPGKLDSVLVHTLTHAYLASAQAPLPAWLNEGVAAFLESLWTEKQNGRDRALQSLESDRPALALAEPPSPGTSAGEPLAMATAPIYYRTKAAYVLWMLRDLTSDQALSTALRGLTAETPAQAAQNTASASLQDMLKRAGITRDLSWFFSDWVEADKGLPDLAIKSVFPNAASAGTFLVAISLSNAGYASADVPVTVRTAKGAVTERVFIPGQSTAMERIVVMGPPTEVQVNDGTVPETVASVHVTDVNLESSGKPAPSNASVRPR